MTNQYLDFRELDNGGRKTKVVGVFSNRGGDQLATIKWYSAWRSYTLQPEPDTIWNEQCLMDVNSYINRLKAERSEERASERSNKSAIEVRNHRMARLETN